MKEINLTLSQKVLLLILATIGFTILFSFFFLHFLYKDLYLSSIRESVIYQGERTASHYHYGSLSEEIIEKIHWYNVVSEYEILVVDNLKELSSYFPYEINDEALVNRDDRQQLLDGNYVLKEGYVEEFDRTVVGAIFPIKSDTALIGYIYIYVPLAAIQEVFQESIPILILAGAAYFLVLFLVVNRIRRSLFQPLTEIQNFSKEVSKGNYSNRLYPQNKDEVGELAEAFNSMSHSLEQQEERKKEFISNVVHELRTPLTYIGGYTQALKQQIFNSPEEAEKYLLTIEKETDRLNKLIHDLVDLNHLQEDLYVLEKEPIAIAQLLFDTLELFQIHLADKNLNIKLSVQDDLIIFGDPKRIQQVLYNILDNAIKYSMENTEIEVQLKEVNETMQFEVTNKGILIQDEDINRIGERFFRTDKARGRSTGGSGLGLSIVKEIVQLHSGTFSIASHSIRGTTVTVKLPQLT
ncbi:two-component sensor histidine kinase [Bacillus sp. M6-12]|uniref:sensor histidine kinase n=1 Tax=Bacillus sp. M6-12 TaxID=2054166 RepID=UPI000C789946|nr:HAMP domain-containing sensor histidine kinase [Bacillus sp. M6-12]PLS18214.1 two-component sensor histidine kinase [Bacillus sp. M6-12]